MCEGGGVLTTFSLLGIAFGIIGIILGSISLKEVREDQVSEDELLDLLSRVGLSDFDTEPTAAPDNSAPDRNQDTSETLEAILDRGYLLCGIPDGQTGFAIRNGDEMVGFDADLCRAVAAAVFGKSEDHIEFVPIASAADRWRFLQDKTVDMLARVTTHTMERDVNEPSVGSGFEFSPPYLYNGLGFGGVPPFGGCADRLETMGECTGLLICVNQGTTHIPIVRKLFAKSNVLPVGSASELYVNLIAGKCNAIAEEQTGIADRVVRVQGYEGEYEVGTTQYSKEPLACVTREGDAWWSDFVFWTIEALLGADERGIKQTSADQFPETPHFGDDYSQMFQNAIRDVGNYGEMYDRHLQILVPRSDLNTINNGTSGLIYSFPFGSLLTVGKVPSPGGTIDAIRTRGHLKCGITSRASFGVFNTVQRDWSGLDVDYCRALTAAIFDGVDRHVVYVVLPATDRFVALESGHVDVLSRITTFTNQRDRNEPTTGAGFSFAPVDFYDGLSFGGVPPYGECADKLDTISPQCQGLLICVNDGTTTIARARALFPEALIVPQPSGSEVLENLGIKCNAIGGGSHDIAEAAVRNSGYTGLYEVGSTRHSKEPLALVTREDDPQWTNFVRWVVFGTFYAEEEGITQATASQMPRSDLFGALLRNMFINSINAVGNYGEIYNRSVEGLVPREGGLNAINGVPSGPQQYPGVF